MEEMKESSRTELTAFGKGTVTALILLALISAVFLAPLFSSKSFNRPFREELDHKQQVVTSMSASAAAASVAVSAIPGDTASPVANKLIDLSGYFVVILGAVYLEKFSLSITGILAFRFLIPAALIVFALALGLRKSSLIRLGARLLLFGIIIAVLVPVSMTAASKIERDNLTDISDTIASAEQTPSSLTESAAESASDSVTSAAESASDDTKDEGFLSKAAGALNGAREAVGGALNEAQEAVGGAVEGAASAVTGAVTGAVEEAKDYLNRLLNAIAVMIVTSLVIPVLVLLVFIWAARILLGIRSGLPDAARLKASHLFIRK